VAVPGGSVVGAVGAELMTSMCLDDEARSIGECSGSRAMKGRVRPCATNAKAGAAKKNASGMRVFMKPTVGTS
jgi:hypothetical protein